MARRKVAEPALRISRAEAAKLREQQPDVSIASLTANIKSFPFKDLSFLERHTELLRKAGLPE